MDDAFFGLKRRPFSPLPDPAFFYLGRAQQEAIRLIESSLQIPAGGWILITGEAGSGKTILGRYLLGRLRSWARGLISFAQPAPEVVLLGVHPKAGPRALSADRVLNQQDLLRALTAESDAGRPALLILDAAHRLTPEAISALMRIATRGVKTLWLAEPQVRELIARCEPQGFVGQLSAFYQLRPLGADEIYPYIQHRLQLAGASDPIFDDEACIAIFEQTQGVPRLINRLCERALILADGQGRRSIDRSLIESLIRSEGEDPASAVARPIEARSHKAVQSLKGAMTPQVRAFATKSVETEPLSRDPLPPPRVRPPRPHPKSQGLPKGLRLIDGNAEWEALGPPSPPVQPKAQPSRTRTRRWSAITLGLIIMGGALGWFISRDEIPWFGHSTLAPPPSPSAESPSDPLAQEAQVSAQPPEAPLFEDLIRLAQEPSPSAVAPPTGDEGVGPLGSEPALQRLAAELGDLGIPSEWRAPNHLRADLSQRIQFREGSRALDESARALLARFAALIKDKPGIRIHIRTHTDTRGSRANNQRLSERRAADIALVLRLNGVAGGRITYEGKGASEPKFSAQEEQRLGPWVNRRVEIDLIAEGRP